VSGLDYRCPISCVSGLDYYRSVIPMSREYTVVLHGRVLATPSTSTKNTLVIVISDSYAVLPFVLQCLYSNLQA